MLGFLHSLALHSPGLSRPRAPAQQSLNPSAGKSLWLHCHDGLALYVLALGLAGNTNHLRKQLFLYHTGLDNFCFITFFFLKNNMGGRT